MPIYWRSDHFRDSVKNGCSAFPVVPAFLVVPAFPIVLAFRSFQLSGHSSFPVVLAILWSYQSPKSQEIQNGEAQQTIRRALPIEQEIAYYFGLTERKRKYVYYKKTACSK